MYHLLLKGRKATNPLQTRPMSSNLWNRTQRIPKCNLQIKILSFLNLDQVHVALVQSSMSMLP